ASGHDVVAMLDGRKPVPTRSPPTMSSSSSSSPNLSMSSSWASLKASPKTAQTPAMAFSDEPDDDFAVVRPSPWRVPLLLLFAGGVSAGAYFGAEAFNAAADAADAVDVAPADHRFELAALVSRATLAMEKNRNDDARIALDTALALAVGDETIEPLLLRTELMLRQGNVVEAEAMLRRLPSTLSAEQRARRDVLLARATPPTSPSSTTSSSKPEPRRPADVVKPPPPAIEATKPVASAKKPDDKKPDDKKPDDKKPDDKKPDDKKPDDRKPDDKKEPSPAPAEPARPSQLDDAVFDDVTRTSRAQVSFCYAEHELSSDDARTGAMKVSATIAPDGSVRRVVVLASDFEGNADFTTCVIKAVGEWHFPPFPGGDDVVSHVFNFRPKPSP
ncbi:MAG TPA: AgmX/PglI C-terminal domain-containing protein, partial [Myxococcota bacterium]